LELAEKKSVRPVVSEDFAPREQLTVQNDSGKQVLLSRADLEALPHVRANAAEHSSGPVNFEGVTLKSVLESVKLVVLAPFGLGSKHVLSTACANIAISRQEFDQGLESDAHQRHFVIISFVGRIGAGVASQKRIADGGHLDLVAKDSSCHR
jgi:hypothetical protein